MTNLEKKISVVIPVYNGETYIRRCLTSVLSQTYRNIEVVVVNDGSTDHSGEVLKQIAEEDSRVQVVTQKNGGSAKARRVGVTYTSGEYVTFVDVDDSYCRKDALELVAGYLDAYQVDVLQFSFQKKLHYVRKPVPCTDQVLVQDRQAFMTDHYPMLLGSYYDGSRLTASTYDKVYRRELFDHILSADDTRHIFMGDDVYLNLHMLQNVNSICFIPEVLYTYQMLTGGTGRFNARYMQDYQVVKENQLYFIGKYGKEFPWKQDMEYYCHAETAWCFYAYTLSIVRSFPKEEAMERINACYEHEFVRWASDYFKTHTITDTYAPTLDKIHTLTARDTEKYYADALEANRRSRVKNFIKKFL